MQLIGKIPYFQEQQFSEKFDSEIIETDIESVILYHNASELVEKRAEYAVIEDDFGPALEKMLQDDNTPSFESLVEACRKFDEENYIQLHCAKSKKTFQFFTEKGVDEDSALAYAFAIAFYTGAYSWVVNMETNVFVRRLQANDLTNTETVNVDEKAAIIMYYLIKGLSHITFYWGVVKRYVKLQEKELEDYQPGALVTWLQFSSAEKSNNTLEWFKERNTIFTIFSLTGRNIQYFSNCGDVEDEVLFLPYSSFLVCYTETDAITGKHHIHMRQIELGLCKYVVMWVDDNIFDKSWENKGHMEKASTLGTHINVHFIPKSNTQAALAFLRSELGQRLKTNDTFRIVTDMNRTNEKPSGNAGARFLYEVRKLGFDHECMIFTMDEREAHDKIRHVFNDHTPYRITVATHTNELEKFVLFQ
ncbi:unnamed protein product [Rotaria sp. Silwood1]|nr:unnamed protein product [Rotaria sp. Silwood1]